MTILPLVLLLQAAAQGPYPDVVARSHIDKSRSVDFHALVTPDTVYVGQQASYQLGVFLDEQTRQRLRRNPEFVPPESQSMLSYDLPDRSGGFVATLEGQRYEVHVFRRALFPLTPGRYQIPAARLTYTMPQSSSFFSREESYSLRSEAATLVAIDPPTVGRPKGWTGAVGVWQATARIDSSGVRAGDPLVFTLRIEGTGNVTLVPRPALAMPWASVVAADERVALDSTPAALRGSKEFDWLITPAADGPQQVPAIRFVYFNPHARRYEETVTRAFTVRVAPGNVVAVQETRGAAAATAPLTLRTVLGEETPRPLGDEPVVRWLLLVAPLFALAAWIAKRPRRTRKVATPRDRLGVLARAGNAAAVADVRRAFLDGLQLRTGLEAAELTGRSAWSRALRMEGVGDDTARAAELFVERLDTMVFGGAPAGMAALATEAADLLRRVDAEAVTRRTVRAVQRAALPAVCAVIVIGAGALLALDAQNAHEPFAEGVTAYAGADYLRAERLFEDAAREAPRAAAAWANAGTAAWAAHDTADAVTGWQRALRLDPTAPELRDRLALVRAPQDVGEARVPTLPARLPSALAIAAWIAGWLLVARQAWRRRRAVPLALCTLLVGGAAAFAARGFENALEGRNLAVIVDPAPLRAAPALGAESGVVPLAGEVAHVVTRQGVWSHIALDGGRNGWIPTERLARLGRD